MSERKGRVRKGGKTWRQSCEEEVRKDGWGWEGNRKETNNKAR